MAMIRSGSYSCASTLSNASRRNSAAGVRVGGMKLEHRGRSESRHGCSRGRRHEPRIGPTDDAGNQDRAEWKAGYRRSGNEVVREDHRLLATETVGVGDDRPEVGK